MQEISLRNRNETKSRSIPSGIFRRPDRTVIEFDLPRLTKFSRWSFGNVTRADPAESYPPHRVTFPIFEGETLNVNISPGACQTSRRYLGKPMTKDEQETNNDPLLLENAPTPKKKRGKIASMTREQRKNYDAEKQREHRQREAAEAEKTAELVDSDQVCSKADATAILAEKFSNAEPLDHLISTAYDLAISACDKLKLCPNRYVFRHGLQATLRALEPKILLRAEMVGEDRLKVFVSKVAHDGAVIVPERAAIYAGHWEDLIAPEDLKPGDLLDEPVTRATATGFAHVPANSARVFVTDRKLYPEQSIPVA